ncbi:hypothetical protein NKJ84_28105 [Mesorhizobium sp. M0048]|uniref:MIT C-terminal domain-containing protein n=1 Tax=Mesorhizobium sp. M0048 TaxID=2956860 RepID=UPI00333D4CC8
MTHFGRTFRRTQTPRHRPPHYRCRRYLSRKEQSNLIAVETDGAAAGIKLTWEIDRTNTIHACHITSDTGWKISLDRGLDIFQKFEMNDAFSLANRLQAYRQVKAFEVTYLRKALDQRRSPCGKQVGVPRF